MYIYIYIYTLMNRELIKGIMGFFTKTFLWGTHPMYSAPCISVLGNCVAPAPFRLWGLGAI